MARRKNKTSPPRRLLYEQAILPSGKLSLSEQIHDILLRQIHAGRWRIGSRLPSISELAAESGLSRQPIQQAFDSLRAEGYVRSEQGNGTFLASVLPEGKSPVGAIGVVMFSHEDTPRGRMLHELDHWRLHAIIQESSKRNYTHEIKFLHPLIEAEQIVKVGGFFSDRVKGVISLHSFPHSDDQMLAPDALPFVFLGSHTFHYGPCVALDLEEGFWRLTREVIARGHRRIILAGREFPQVRDAPNLLAGYERAMGEAGLFVDRRAFEASLALDFGQLPVVRAFVEAHGPNSPAPDGGATAFVCADPAHAMNIIAVADMIGIRVPEDLSVVSLLSGPMRFWRPDQRLTGIEYDLEHAVNVCYDVLLEQMRTRRNLVSLIRLKPLIRQGDSLAPPPGRSGSNDGG